MSEAKFTPGKSLFGAVARYVSVQVGKGGTGGMVRASPIQAGYVLYSDYAKLSREKDALYSACKATLEGLSNMYTEQFQRGEDRPLREMLRAALAKATGDA